MYAALRAGTPFAVASADRLATPPPV